ncbi:hypothetical protein, conserved [Trypanosoma cruzi]|uniref:Uncharacterized protein n=1 Tax=Trypanosoma cruzi (strain CL Brener) TaxID=353153 RepID=Q4D9W5_TRYCC|nr:hypothetical protein, conserved [Trypanosoma cruzi]EAN89318.1 hypothetical protein, conserved [Trypanosoma cruzi]|eukprot:XP_811169.1 hypothetical protein [Trypanosoma cruzi strain CL Brener]
MREYGRGLNADDAPPPRSGGTLLAPLRLTQQQQQEKRQPSEVVPLLQHLTSSGEGLQQVHVKMGAKPLQPIGTMATGAGSQRAGQAMTEHVPLNSAPTHLSESKAINSFNSSSHSPLQSFELKADGNDTMNSTGQLKQAPFFPIRLEEPRGAALEPSIPRVRQTVVFVEGSSCSQPPPETANSREPTPQLSHEKEQKINANSSTSGWNANYSPPFSEANNTSLPLNDVCSVSNPTVGGSRTLPVTRPEPQINENPPKIAASIKKLGDINLSAFTQWCSENVLDPNGLTERRLGRRRSRRWISSTWDLVSATTVRSRKTKGSSVSMGGATKRTTSNGSNGGIFTPEDSTLKIPPRETREGLNRRLKKDAQSLYSLELPTFDEETGTLGDACVFPRSLAVDVAVEHVISQERGELRTKATGVGILRFLKEFDESCEIIYLYFWYAIAHIRRIKSEKMLIGRYINLERIVRGAFPRYKAEMPTIKQIGCILAKYAPTDESISENNSVAAAREEVEVEEAVPPFFPAISNVHLLGGPGSIVSEESGRTAFVSQYPKKKRPRTGSGGADIIQAFDEAVDKSLLQDPAIISLCNEAINAFTVVQMEVYELAEFAQRCFHRLAVLFGQAFERLAEEKDEVLTAFTFIVPHVVYYVFVYCFPNDVVAGIFNAALRMNLYRIFYFWCSGLVATYVRVNRWPKPLTDGKKSLLKFIAQQAGSPTLSQSTASVISPISPKRGGSAFIAQGESNSQGVVAAIGNSKSLSSPTAMGEERLEALADDTFEEVDVEVANGHYRIALEFKKYAKHVNYLLQELQKRTEDMHREAAHSSLIPTPTDIENTSMGGMAQPDRFFNKLPSVQMSASPQLRTVSWNGGSAKKKMPETRQLPRKSTLLIPSNNHDAAGNYDEAVLPAISQANGAVKKTKALPVNNDCILSGFPLEHTAIHVKQYMMRPTGVAPAKVPLPPLNVPSTEGTNSNEAASPHADKHHTLPSLRTVKVPLPVASPFFQHYSSKRLASNAAGINEKSFPRKSTRHDKPHPFFSECVVPTSMGSPSSSISHATATRNSVGSLSSSTLAPSISQKRGVGAKNPTNSLMLPHVRRKAINLMLIPPSDAQLRPLKFKSLTREVTRRQLEIERQMDRLSGREQILRRKYDAETQQGSRRVHQLLSECHSDKQKIEAYAGFLSDKRKKNEDTMRRKQKFPLERIKR